MKPVHQKLPIENWRIELVEDEQDLGNLLAAGANIGPNVREALVKTFERARHNVEKYLEVCHFNLSQDGRLYRGKVFPSGAEVNVLQIDFTDISHPGFLSRLDVEINLRKRRQSSSFDPWAVYGYLKGNPTYIDYLELSDDGGFFLRNRREFRTFEKRMARNPLAARKQ